MESRLAQKRNAPLPKDQVQKLKAKARLLEPVVRIGKNGLTDAMVDHVKVIVRKRKLIKVKFLRAFVEENDRKAAAKRLADEAGAYLIDQVGFTVVLYKR